MQDIRVSMSCLLEEDHPMSVRQVFYRLVSMGAIDKTEAEYKTVVRLLGDMRRSRDIPFDWLADATRWQRKPRTHSSLERMLERSAECYRRSIWDSQDVYVEVWSEKEALSGVVYPKTAAWDVPLMVTRGYPSISYLYAAAEAMDWQEKPCYLYYFGDHDPSGVDIPRKVEADLREFAPDVDLHFERVAVNLEQVKKWGLQTRPTKKTDSRSKTFKGESVEVDAIPPSQLRELVSACIEQHVDQDTLDRMRLLEKAERRTLRNMVRQLGGDDA